MSKKIGNRRPPQTKAEFYGTKFDGNWVDARSSIRDRMENVATYDVTYSWEARSDNPKANSKLQATELALQYTRPITMSGNAVIGLEKSKGMDVLNVKQNITQAAFVPLNASQVAVGMLTDYSAKIPMLINAYEDKKQIVMTEPEAFRNMTVNEPQFVSIEKPKALVEAGWQCDQKLLSPAQRREILDFEQRKNLATHIIRGATAMREKLTKQMKGIMFHRGVLGVDAVENENSEIYGERARKDRETKEFLAHKHLERHTRLSIKNGGMATNGNILVPNSVADRIELNKDFQSKQMKNTGFTFNETYSRLFVRVDGKVEGDRTQHLREKDLNGKNYNIVTHAGVEHWPVSESSGCFSPEHKIMTHMSQNSLEAPRNLQGALKHVR